MVRRLKPFMFWKPHMPTPSARVTTRPKQTLGLRIGLGLKSPPFQLMQRLYKRAYEPGPHLDTIQ